MKIQSERFINISLPGLGIIFMLLSTIGFSAMHALVRHLSSELHPFEIAFCRNLFGLFVVLPWFIRFGWEPLRTKRPGLHILRACINIFAMLMFFMALSLTELAKIQALSFTAPLFATLLAIFFLKEKVRLRRWIALLIGFTGAMLIIRPGFATVDIGSLLVLGSAAIWACALIVIKILSRTDSAVTITTYMALLMTPLSLIPALFYWQWPDAGQWFLLVMIGISGTLAQMSMAQAFRVADATAVMPIDFMKLVWGTMLGYLIFSEIPDIWTLLGGTIIFAGAGYIAYRENRQESKQSDNPGGALPAGKKNPRDDSSGGKKS